MRRYWIVTGSILAFLLVLFLLVEALGVPLLTDPSPWLERAGVLAALVGVGLLVTDVALPVPSSLVMIAHGALFGVAIGTLLSAVGSTGTALVGFAVGRRGGPLLARLVSPEERARVDRLLTRWGALAIIVTRPV
ncbi:MAG: VTT domain-containing protein [Actinomycetota bacterium]|nr:VTT domain-containing protein [Actinomycetota bacterium]